MKSFFQISAPLDKLSIEEKILIWLLRLTFLLVLASAFINFYTNFQLVAGICLGLLCLYPFLHYLAYRKKQVQLSIILYAASSLIFLSIFWFLNAGIDGRVNGFFPVLGMLFAIILQPKQQVFGITAICLCILFLGIIQFLFPYLVIPYDDNISKFVDIILTNIILSITSFYVIKVMMKNYEENRREIIIKDFEILKKNKILEQKSLELEEQNKKLAVINESQNRLFSLISHDLRSPLTSSKALVELVYQGDMSIEQLKEVIPDMYNNLNFTLSLVDNLLFWAKSQFSNELVNIEPIKLYDFLWNLLDRLSILTHYKKIQLEVNIPKEEDININFDKQILEIAIRNIFSNAIKFSLEYATIRIESYIESNFLVINIIDNGLGISSENLDKIKKGIIFSNKGTLFEKGTGLGLSLSQSLLQRCNSFLEIESKEQKGAKVAIKIPSEYIL